MTTPSRLRLAVAACAAAACAGCTSSTPRTTPTTTPTTSATSATSSGAGSPSTSPAPTSTAPAYLALGDSVPFGYDASRTASRPATFRGYPEYAARLLHLPLTNASCPGETTETFVDARATRGSNLCGIWRALAPLHVRYAGAQLPFALAFLASHPRTRLVSLTLGANDLITCGGRGSDACHDPAVVQAVLDAAKRRLKTIVTALRGVYQGPLVAVTYYATDYSSLGETLALHALDGALAAVVQEAGGVVADGYAVFRRAAAASDGDACAAGLLARASLGGCDIHPSARGARVLAAALIHAYRQVGPRP